MEPQKPQLTVDDAEISLIKSVFADNDALLKAIRALFLNLDVTALDRDMVRAAFSGKPALLKIMHKRFNPKLDRDTPIGQQSDSWLGAEGMVFGAQRDTIEQAVSYKEQALKMLSQALLLLENPEGELLDLDYTPSLMLNDPLRIHLLARNQYIRHVESQLLFLKLIAGQKSETAEAAKERLMKSSSK